MFEANTLLVTLKDILFVKERILVLVLMLFSLNSKAVNNYYQLLRKAEKCIISNDLDSALFFYDKAFVKYNYPFVRDVVSATYIAGYAEDKPRFETYIRLLIKRGINKHDFLKIVKRFHKENEFDTLNNIYHNSIDNELSDMFKKLDVYNQLYVVYGKRKNRLNKIKNHVQIVDSTLVCNYVQYVREYGYPTEDRVGLGSVISIIDGKRKQLGKLNCIEAITDIEFNRSNKGTIFYLSSDNGIFAPTRTMCRRGNNFLWHIDIKRFRELDSILLKGIRELKVYPQFYASCLERHGIDYLLAWCSDLNQKYKFDLKKAAKDSNVKEINKRRAIIGIRSVEMDLKLFEAIAKLEDLKYKECFSRRSRVNNILFGAMFISKIP